MIEQLDFDSQLRTGLREGTTKIGEYTVAEFRFKVVPSIEEKEQATTSELEAAAYLTMQFASDNILSSRNIPLIAEAFAKANQHDRARRFLNRVRYPGLSVRTVSDEIYLANGYSAIGDFETAITMLNKVKSTLTDDDTFDVGILGEVYARAGDYTQSVEVLRRDPESWGFDYGSPIGNIIEFLADENKVDELQPFLDIARSLNFTDTYNRAIPAVVMAYARQEKYQEATQLVESLDNRGSKAVAASALSNVYLDNDMYAEALTLADQSLEMVNGEQDASVAASGLLAIADVYIQAEQQAKALDVLSQAFEHARRFDTYRG